MDAFSNPEKVEPRPSADDHTVHSRTAQHKASIHTHCLNHAENMSYKDIVDHLDTLVDIRDIPYSVTENKMEDCLDMYAQHDPRINVLRHLLADPESSSQLFWALMYFQSIKYQEAMAGPDQARFCELLVQWTAERNWDVLHQEAMITKLLNSEASTTAPTRVGDATLSGLTASLVALFKEVIALVSVFRLMTDAMMSSLTCRCPMGVLCLSELSL